VRMCLEREDRVSDYYWSEAQSTHPVGSVKVSLNFFSKLSTMSKVYRKTISRLCQWVTLCDQEGCVELRAGRHGTGRDRGEQRGVHRSRSGAPALHELGGH
jgi:hypothetical protein